MAELQLPLGLSEGGDRKESKGKYPQDKKEEKEWWVLKETKILEDIEEDFGGENQKKSTRKGKKA